MRTFFSISVKCMNDKDVFQSQYFADMRRAGENSAWYFCSDRVSLNSVPPRQIATVLSVAHTRFQSRLTTVRGKSHAGLDAAGFLSGRCCPNHYFSESSPNFPER